MGMGRGIQIVLEWKKLGLFDDLSSVMDMGAQEIHMKYDEFVYLMDAYGIKIDLSKFEDLKDFPKKRMPTKTFWQSIGFQKTDCIDIINKYGAIEWNLNFPFERKEYWGKYDLVTDFGNNEHPFNVAEAYRTMHRLCKKDGYLWIDQAVINGNGYFNFDLAFFEGMAAANNYGIVYSAFIVNAGKAGDEYHIPCSKDILGLFDFNRVKTLSVNYLFKKNTDDDFNFPIQGMPKPEIPFLGYRVAYVSHSFPPERYYIPSQPLYSGRFLVKELLKKIKKRLFG